MENKYSLFNIKLICTSIICLLYFSSRAQTYNAYARVNSINAGRTILTLSGGENHVAHNFAVGEPVIVMQMQADVIGANTSNANTFGNLSAIGTAGLYEVRYISAVAFTGAVPNFIT